MQIMHFNFRTLEEALELSAFITTFFPEDKRLCIELGINEVFFNAIEHGNLNITFEEKTRLKKENRWYEEIQRRLQDPFNRTKMVNVTLEINPSQIVIQVEDQGPGFKWITPAHDTTMPHGRGLLLAENMSFDNMEFLGKGNKVRCLINNYSI